MNEIVLETERLSLRKMTPQDVDNLQLIFSDPIAMFFYNTLNREETLAWINKAIADYETHGAGMWICQLKGTGEFIGQCGLHFQAGVDGKDEIEVGYLFLRQYWSQGYATEAVKGVIDYARNQLGFKRLISLVSPENHPARRLAEKNGFSAEKEIEYKGAKYVVYVNEG